MNLHNLINQGRIVESGEVDISQIKSRFSTGMNYFVSAKELFNCRANEDSLNVIYSNFYDSARIFCQTAVLLSGYKTSGKYHHETTFLAAQSIINDPEMDDPFKKFERMRSRRNTIEYGPDLIEISVQDIKQTIKDVQRLADKLNFLINEKMGQQRLI